MKPIILYVEDGHIKLTKEKLDKIIDEAYQRGYEDGEKTNITYSTPNFFKAPEVPCVADSNSTAKLQTY